MNVPRSRRCTWGGKTASERMSFPPDLLDELARVFARAAVEAFLAALSGGEDLKESLKETNNSSPTDHGRTSQDTSG